MIVHENTIWERGVVRTGTVLLCIFLLLLFCGCASKRYIPKGAEFDERFVGIWRGELPVGNTDKLRRWKKKRRLDGAMVINIGLYDKGMVYLGREILTGVWWVEGSYYYEKIPGLNDLLVPHKFTVVSDGLLKLQAMTDDTEEAEEVYSFTEKKVGEAGRALSLPSSSPALR